MKKCTLLNAIGILATTMLLACGESTLSSSDLENVENEGLATIPDTVVLLDTLITADTLIMGKDTVILKDTVLTPTDTLIIQVPANSSSSSVINPSVSSSSVLESEDGIYTERDLEQTADLSEAVYIQLVSGQDVSITQEGVYVLSGSATDVSIVVDADSEAKVQIVLDGVSVTNADAPVVYVKSADKVFITTTHSTNYMEVSGAFVADGETNLDAVIFSKDDLVLNGVGTLEIKSAQGNGITTKDDLKITGGTLILTAAGHGLEANDSINIADGNITIEAGADGLHSEYDEDDTVGSIHILGGSFTIQAGDDGIRATSILQIDGGTINVLSSVEGLEATYVLINNGTITVNASDDGINATNKSYAYSVLIEVNGGNIQVTVGNGDTDAFDSNGNIVVNDGVIVVTAPTSSFDADGTATLNGGTVTVNGQVVTSLGGGMMPPGGRW